MAKKALSLSDQIRQLVAESELSRYRISKETGIDAATLSRFMSGKGFLSEDKLNRLGKFLGWEIRVKEKKHG